jgi:hypothetical protein
LVRTLESKRAKNILVRTLESKRAKIKIRLRSDQIRIFGSLIWSKLKLMFDPMNKKRTSHPVLVLPVDLFELFVILIFWIENCSSEKARRRIS